MEVVHEMKYELLRSQVLMNIDLCVAERLVRIGGGSGWKSDRIAQ